MVDVSELIGRLDHLVSLDKPEKGGPYGGLAAQECVKAMRDAANALRSFVPEELAPKNTIDDERTVLTRLAAGDSIAFSRDGDHAWFVGGDRAWVGDVIIRMRKKGYLRRVNVATDPEHDYGERDVLSDAGRALLHALDNQNEAGR